MTCTLPEGPVLAHMFLLDVRGQNASFCEKGKASGELQIKFDERDDDPQITCTCCNRQFCPSVRRSLKEHLQILFE